MPSLLEALQRSDSDLIQHRALLVLHHTVKALASKKLVADRRVFHDMVNELLPYVLRIWQAHHNDFMQKVRRSLMSFRSWS